MVVGDVDGWPGVPGVLGGVVLQCSPAGVGAVFVRLYMV